MTTEYSLACLCRRLIAKHSIGTGKMHIYVPSGILRRTPAISPGCSKLSIFVEMNLCGCKSKIIIEIGLSVVTDFRDPLTTSIKTVRGLDILHVYGISLAGSQSAKSLCHLLLSTQLDVNIVTMFAHEAASMSISDFALPPWRGAVMRYTEEYLGFGY